MLNHKMDCNNEWTEVTLSLNIGCYNLHGAVCFRIELTPRQNNGLTIHFKIFVVYKL